MWCTSASTSRRAALRALAAAALLGVAAGCASLRPPLEPPQVEVASVRVVSLMQGVLDVEVGLSLRNPNALSLSLASLDATLAVEGQPLAVFALPRPVTLAANATTPVAIDARANVATALALAARAVGGASAARYELTGVAVEEGGRRWPFTRRGEIPTSRLVPSRP